MNQKDRIVELSRKAWEYRREMGFSAVLPTEIREGVAELRNGGISSHDLGKALGVTKTTVTDWAKKYSKSVVPVEPAIEFQEVQVVDEKPMFEIKVMAKVQGCHVEIRGSEFVLVQRLFRKLSK